MRPGSDLLLVPLANRMMSGIKPTPTSAARPPTPPAQGSTHENSRTDGIEREVQHILER